MSLLAPPTTTWIDICPAAAIPAGAGVAANVAGHQVALLRTDAGDLHAIDNRDPFTGANVLARGIVGMSGARPIVASPLRKQRFCLVTGACLDDESVALTVHEVRTVLGRVQLRLPSATGPAPARPTPDQEVS